MRRAARRRSRPRSIKKSFRSPATRQSQRLSLRPALEQTSWVRSAPLVPKLSWLRRPRPCGLQAPCRRLVRTSCIQPPSRRSISGLSCHPELLSSSTMVGRSSRVKTSLFSPDGMLSGATCELSYPAPGEHRITVSYAGDENFVGSTSSSAQTVIVHVDRAGAVECGSWVSERQRDHFVHGSMRIADARAGCKDRSALTRGPEKPGSNISTGGEGTATTRGDLGGVLWCIWAEPRYT